MRTAALFPTLFAISCGAPATLQSTFESQLREDGVAGHEVLGTHEHDDHALIAYPSWTADNADGKNRPSIGFFENTDDGWRWSSGTECTDRGVTFLGDHAVVGVSRPRENRTFDGLALNDRLAKEGVEPVCHLAVINLNSGDVEHRLVIEGVVEELYDVVAIPGVLRPQALGFKSDEIRFAVKPVM